jgi:putative FmdB family regulatory protein
MPLFDWKCEDCGHEFEQVMSMARTLCPFEKCEDGQAVKKFTPTKNFLIPASFKRSSTWHMPEGERGSDSAPASSNNAVHAPRRTSFKEQFEKQWR